MRLGGARVAGEHVIFIKGDRRLNAGYVARLPSRLGSFAQAIVEIGTQEIAPAHRVELHARCTPPDCNRFWQALVQGHNWRPAGQRQSPHRPDADDLHVLGRRAVARTEGGPQGARRLLPGRVRRADSHVCPSGDGSGAPTALQTVASGVRSLSRILDEARVSRCAHDYNPFDERL